MHKITALSCHTAGRRDFAKVTRLWQVPVWMLRGALIMLVASLGLVGLRAAGDELNLSASMPRGLYRVTHDPLAVGQVVAICLPTAVAQFGRERGYLTAGACR